MTLSFISEERSGTERAREQSSDSETHDHIIMVSPHVPHVVTGVSDGGQGRGGAVWCGGGGAGGVATGGAAQQPPDDPLLLGDGPVLVADQPLQLLLPLHQVSLEQVQRLPGQRRKDNAI